MEQDEGIVPGNHEFYNGYDIAQTMVDYEYEYRDNVRYLNNTSIVLADYWFYGHTHYSNGSGTVIGKTKLLCNQLGYVFYGENKDFVPDACIDV